MQFILTRGIHTQADLVDQLFNSSERRLARTLLIMAKYGDPGALETLIPEITRETLVEMIGSTRSRVSFFMNRFRELGYIEYNGRIRVHTSLLNVVLHDELPEENTSRPKLLDPPLSKSRTTRSTRFELCSRINKIASCPPRSWPNVFDGDVRKSGFSIASQGSQL
jgi:hypothetical protein